MTNEEFPYIFHLTEIKFLPTLQNILSMDGGIKWWISISILNGKSFWRAITTTFILLNHNKLWIYSTPMIFFCLQCTYGKDCPIINSNDTSWAVTAINARGNDSCSINTVAHTYIEGMTGCQSHLQLYKWLTKWVCKAGGPWSHVDLQYT